MDFANAIKSGFNKYAVFSGVASRSEFWYWILFTQVVSWALGLFAGAPNSSITNTGGAMTTFSPMIFAGTGALGSIWGIAILIPTVAVATRRLRDAGVNPKLLWLLTMGLLPMIVAVTVLALGWNAALSKAALGVLSAVVTGAHIEITMFIWAVVLVFILLGLGLGIMFLIWLTKPTKTAEQGNRFLQSQAAASSSVPD